MKKEEILQMSREENTKGYDERERAVHGTASKIALGVGGMLCVALLLISEFVLGDLTLSIAKRDLVFGITDIAVSILSLIMLIVKG